VIVKFPLFESISINSREDINRIVAKFPPYSDFNFISMFTWDIKNNMLISQLNNNLVVRFKDYQSDDTFLSFIGDSKIDASISTLLTYVSSNNLGHALHLIPEHVVGLIKHPSNFIIEEDRDNHDYVVMAFKFSKLEGKNYASKRNGINKFIGSYGDKVKVKKSAIDENTISDIMKTFHDWQKESGKTWVETSNELMQIEKLAEYTPDLALNVMGIYIDDVMVAYSIYEIQDVYAIGHSEKALKSHAGLYDFLKHSTAQDLHIQGVQYINYEQDLGIESLRQSKMLLHPETFLKKYTISPIPKK